MILLELLLICLGCSGGIGKATDTQSLSMFKTDIGSSNLPDLRNVLLLKSAQEPEFSGFCIFENGLQKQPLFQRKIRKLELKRDERAMFATFNLQVVLQEIPKLLSLPIGMSFSDKSPSINRSSG